MMNSPRHFVDIDDLSQDELFEVLDRSERDNLDRSLAGRTVALLFQKPSTRTRHSSEAAVAQLGGHAVYTRPEEVGIDERETAEDIARTLSSYHAAIAVRVFEHSILTRMANVSRVPVINLLSNDSHPVQALADLLTIKQEFGSLDGKTIVYVGDANNVAFSLGVGAVVSGARFIVSHPDEYGFSDAHEKHFASLTGEIESIGDPFSAVKEADVIYTDAWYSMGQETEAQKREPIFQPYQVNDDLMSAAPNSAIFMHCLPAHRNHEATDSVLDGNQSRIWQQAENRMHTMRGLLSFLTQQ